MVTLITERIFLLFKSTAIWILKYPFFLTFHLSLPLYTGLYLLPYNVTIYCKYNIIIFKILFLIIYLDIQPDYSSIYCRLIRNSRYFSMDMSLCNSFGLSIRKMKVCLGITKQKKKCIGIVKWLSNFIFVHLF